MILIGTSIYELVYSQLLISYVWGSFFLFIGIGTSLGLYLDTILKNSKYITYAFIIVLPGITFGVIYFLDISISYYRFIMLFSWVIGGLHFLQQIGYDSKNRVKLVNTFCLYLSLPLLTLLSQYYLTLHGQGHSLVQDEFLMAIDGTLGFYPSLTMGRLIQSLPQNISNVLELGYLLLPFAFLFIYIKIEHREKKIPGDFIIEILLIGLIGYALYNIIPGCGSRYAFNKTWPNSLPLHFIKEDPQWIYCSPSYPRNCLPSLHTAWIICLLRRAWQFDLLTKGLMIGFAMINFIAMFGIGAHYFIDIVVGLAFANCIGGISYVQLPWQTPARLRIIFLGGLLVLSWYIIILYGLPLMQLSKIVAWCIFSASILISLKLEQDLWYHGHRQVNLLSWEKVTL